MYKIIFINNLNFTVQTDHTLYFKSKTKIYKFVNNLFIK